jgi:hypothetical protein
MNCTAKRKKQVRIEGERAKEPKYGSCDIPISKRDKKLTVL